MLSRAVRSHPRISRLRAWRWSFSRSRQRAARQRGEHTVCAGFRGFRPHTGHRIAFVTRIPHRWSSASVRLCEDGLPTGGVVRRLVREHGHEHGEETINNATQRPAVAVPAPAEPLVMVATVGVVPHADEAPVVERVAEARIAGVTHADEETFATLPRHWRD